MIMNVRDELFQKLIKEALAAILTKKITCFGSCLLLVGVNYGQRTMHVCS
jgi:hypothetical protein